MRGLTDGSADPAEGPCQAVITAVAVLAALGLFVSACATGGTGARDEGPAHADTAAAPPAAAPSAARRRGPQPGPDGRGRVSSRTTRRSRRRSSADLKPCVG